MKFVVILLASRTENSALLWATVCLSACISLGRYPIRIVSSSVATLTAWAFLVLRSPIQSALNSGTACSPSVWNILSSRLYLTIKIHRTIILLNLVCHTNGRTQIESAWGEYLKLRGKEWGDWRRLHNEELHNLCVSPNIKVINQGR
jgi:hypothetical protein